MSYEIWINLYSEHLLQTIKSAEYGADTELINTSIKTNDLELL